MQSEWSVNQYHFSFLSNTIFLLSNPLIEFCDCFQFFMYRKYLGDKLLPELFLGSLHSISLLYLKYVSNEKTQKWHHF